MFTLGNIYKNALGWANYLTFQRWQATKIRKSLKRANSKEAIFIAHEKVSSWLNGWGQESEEESPQ